MGYIETLRHEYEAQEGLFLLAVRVQLQWDKSAFTLLTAAMKQCCVESTGKDALERWLAELFWYLPAFVRDWTTHPDFPPIYAPAYYDHAYERLDSLAYWFFRGYSPYTDDARFDDPL